MAVFHRHAFWSGVRRFHGSLECQWNPVPDLHPARTYWVPVSRYPRYRYVLHFQIRFLRYGLHLQEYPFQQLPRRIHGRCVGEGWVPRHHGISDSYLHILPVLQIHAALRFLRLSECWWLLFYLLSAAIHPVLHCRHPLHSPPLFLKSFPDCTRK